MKQTLSEQAKDYAIKCHADTNHFYGEGVPYSVHLEMVVNYAKKYIKLLFPYPQEFNESIEQMYAAAWCHDTIEDTRQTYNNVVNKIGYLAAGIVYDLTNEKGKTRAERGNEKYYQELKDNKYAGFIKVCDRLANVKYSKDHGSSMLNAYKKEHEDFKLKLYRPEWVRMFMELDELIYN